MDVEHFVHFGLSLTETVFLSVMRSVLLQGSPSAQKQHIAHYTDITTQICDTEFTRISENYLIGWVGLCFIGVISPCGDAR